MTNNHLLYKEDKKVERKRPDKFYWFNKSRKLVIGLIQKERRRCFNPCIFHAFIINLYTNPIGSYINYSFINK